MTNETRIQESWLAEIIDLPRPDDTPVNLRKNLREKHESSSFNVVHYIAEYLEPEQIEEYISFKAEWQNSCEKDVNFTDDEVCILKELPNKEYLLDDKEILNISLGLVDILFGYCYNHRTTLGENTVESGWTIAKLSSTLSWFEVTYRKSDNCNILTIQDKTDLTHCQNIRWVLFILVALE